MSAATTLSALIARLLGGGAEARAPGGVGEHEREEGDGAAHVEEVEHGSGAQETEGRRGRPVRRDARTMAAPPGTAHKFGPAGR